MQSSYLKINLIFFFILILLFAYSYFYPSLRTYGLSLHSQCISGKCESKGLTQAFSVILRFQTQKAIKINEHSLAVFFFFLSQFFLRIFFYTTYRIVRDKRIAYLDVTLSSILFLYSFLPLRFNVLW